MLLKKLELLRAEIVEGPSAKLQHLLTNYQSTYTLHRSPA